MSYKKEKPQFGHAMLKYYALDPSYLNMNNGSYGTTPRPVLDAVKAIAEKAEANPDLYHRLEYKPLLDEARARVAQLIGAKRDEVVFVTNASTGLNTVLRNIEWEEGDTIYDFSTTYGSISRTVQYISDILPHPSTSVILLEFPMTHTEVLDTFKKHIYENPGKPGKKRVAVIDSIVSNPGVLLPWQEMVKICKQEGIISVIDAAHSIGQEVGIDLHKSDPDFWVSNCHKWLSAKRSAAVLYVPERNQHLLKASIPVSHFYVSPKDRTGPNFVEQFDWNGTIDFSPYITVSDAIEYRKWMGGEEKINEYCHNLAIEGGRVLAKVLGTRVMDPDGELTLNMESLYCVNVEVPLPKGLQNNAVTIMSIHRALLNQKTFSAPFFHNNVWWTRCSAQVWLELSDFEELGKRWLSICAQLKEEFGLGDAK